MTKEWVGSVRSDICRCCKAKMYNLKKTLTHLVVTVDSMKL